jgi:hypothetical protein
MADLAKFLQRNALGPAPEETWHDKYVPSWIKALGSAPNHLAPVGDQAREMRGNALNAPPLDLAMGLLGPRVGRLPKLPMGEPARVARGEQFGGPENWYHGTAQPGFTAFDPSLAGQSAGHALNKRPAVWATRDPHVASDYAMKAVGRGAGDAPAVLPLKVKKGERPVVVDMEGNFTSPQTWYANVENAIAYSLEKSGAEPTSVILRNVPYNLSGKKGVTDMVMVANPEQLRSVFAKFDPKNANTGTLLAGLAGAGLLVPLSEPRD